MFFGILSLSEFARKYGLTEKQKTELVTMQAFYQAIGMLIGMGIAVVGQFALSALLGW